MENRIAAPAVTRQLWKYPVNLGPNSLWMPTGARPVSIGLQGEQLVIWAELDVEAPCGYVNVLVVGTGWDIAASWTYVDTVQVGGFVWHLYWEQT